MAKKDLYSKYWIDDFFEYDDEYEDQIELDNYNTKNQNELTLLKLVMARRAVSNYVSITTNKQIPVYFYGDTSYTNGKSITISSEISNIKNFDVNVGLALHEAHHILHSDFDMLQDIWMHIPDSIHTHSKKLKIFKDDLIDFCSFVWNYVEDRYIDKVSYNKNVGYRPYYVKLYEKYFNNKTISDSLKSELYRTLTLDSYLFRIINMTNDHSDLTALPNLSKINEVIDLKNITRLKKPIDRMECSFEVSEIVLSSIDEYSNKSSNKKSGGSGEKSDLDDFESISEILGGDTTSDQSVNENNVVDDIGNDDSLSPSKLNRLKKLFEKQKSFLSGTVKKKKVTKDQLSTLKSLEDSGVEIIKVGNTYFKDVYATRGHLYHNDPYAECIFYKKVNPEFINSNKFMHYNPRKVLNDTIISEGISLGTKLGKNLQIRNQEIVEKYTHKRSGKLDKRLLYSAGYGSDDIFHSTSTTKYKNTVFHIDVDMSSSMNGSNKWRKTLKLLIAISKAISMLSNVRLRIAFRSSKHVYNKASTVMYYIMFDSKVDHFSKIKNCFRHVFPEGTTPEGLCFEGALSYLKNIDKNSNNIFINISDGEPYIETLRDVSNNMCSSYIDELAIKHTRKQVNEIRKLGYSVISYFIESETYEYWGFDKNKLLNNFKKMYGKDTYFVNPDSLSSLLQTFNEKLLETYITHQY